MSPEERWRGGVLVAAFATLILGAGCADIPDSGGVSLAQVGGADTEPLIRYQPPGPPAGATPVQIVHGFIDAMRAYPVSTDAAQQYLSDEGAASWRPERQTVVYDDISATATVSGQVVLSVRRVATLDARGSYTPIANRLLDAEHAFALTRADGEWRIDNPPDALYVSSDFFADIYQPLSLYFLDRTGRVIVPDPIYLPTGDQLATSLVRGLLQGPTGDLGRRLRTIVPPSTQVDVSVPVRSNGVAEVQLSESVLTLSDAQREQLAAQLVWTLRQVTGIVGVRILSAGVPLDVPGVADVHNLNQWDAYAPTDPSLSGQLFALRRGRLVVVSQTMVSPFEGVGREVSRELSDFDVDRDFTLLAGVSADRSDVLVGDLSGVPGSTLRVLYNDGIDLTDPTWDRTGSLWVADRRPRGTRMLLFDPQPDRAEGFRRIRMGPLDAARIEAFALSTDGLRFVAVTRHVDGSRLGPRRLMMGTVELAGDTRGNQIVDVHEVVTSSVVFDAPTDVGWTDPTTLSVLARVGTVSPQPYEVRIDGSRVEGGVVPPPEPLLPPVGAASLATGASPDSLTYVGNRGGGLWFQDAERQWVRVSRSPLLLPDYPG
ncbi:MtrAB system accessory lipoprotein LpqB [soil metagenome]